MALTCPPAPGAPADAPRLRVVVTDADPAVRRFYKTLLSRDGYEVFEADSATAAVPLCRDVRSDILLTDELPQGADGSASAAVARDRFDVPTVVVSDHPGGSDVWHFPGSPVVTSLTKPASLGALRAAVQTAAKQGRRPLGRTSEK